MLAKHLKNETQDKKGFSMSLEAMINGESEEQLTAKIAEISLCEQKLKRIVESFLLMWLRGVEVFEIKRLRSTKLTFLWDFCETFWDGSLDFTSQSTKEKVFQTFT